MTSAVAILILNISAALLFALSFLIIDQNYGSQVHAKGFALSYIVGTIAPVSELLIMFLGHDATFKAISYAGLLGGLALMSAALVRFYGGVPDIRVSGGLFLVGLALRIAIWNGQRNTLPYEIMFQIPFAAATLLCGAVTIRMYRDKGLSWWLALVFFATGAHFLVKPFAAFILGSGETALEYGRSPYALFSQVTSGIFLTASGLMTILVVFQKAVVSSERKAETDPLTEIPNRRGFDRLAKEAVDNAAEQGKPISAIMLDLDNFKCINDQHGHAFGDMVLVAFSRLLEQATPPDAVIGRIGGEEFAVILIGDAAAAFRIAETIRIATSHLRVDFLDGFTVSGGVAARTSGESMKQLLRVADLASYQAKSGGRNQIQMHAPA